MANQNIEEVINNFLNQKDYDIRKTHNARWIDQKCTCDVISFIADCILEFTNSNTQIEFSISDIWNSDYAKKNVREIFTKPETDSELAESEYDKFFAQPINLLTYSEILKYSGKKGNARAFKINNIDLLKFIMFRDTNALTFLILYIKKVLKDSGIYEAFNLFLNKQDGNSFKKLKDTFVKFTINNTPINQKVECGRIFTKILNPLSFNEKKKGTRKGYLSKTIISPDELKYNRINWRDEKTGKDKLLTRKEYEKNFPLQRKQDYYIQKAKKIVRKYNDETNDALSEVKQSNEIVDATQIHHIFAASEFPQISDFVENLIALTPNQHFSYAHPNNQTSYINKDFQYICLLAKTTTIMRYLQSRDTQGIYTFKDYKYVLNEGLGTKDFDLVNDLDFAALIDKIDFFYSDFNPQKYGDLVSLNKPIVGKNC